jgi:hypothetical protein
MRPSDARKSPSWLTSSPFAPTLRSRNSGDGSIYARIVVPLTSMSGVPFTIGESGATLTAVTRPDVADFTCEEAEVIAVTSTACREASSRDPTATVTGARAARAVDSMDCENGTKATKSSTGTTHSATSGSTNAIPLRGRLIAESPFDILIASEI